MFVLLQNLCTSKGVTLIDNHNIREISFHKDKFRLFDSGNWILAHNFNFKPLQKLL